MQRSPTCTGRRQKTNSSPGHGSVTTGTDAKTQSHSQAGEGEWTRFPFAQEMPNKPNKSSGCLVPDGRVVQSSNANSAKQMMDS